MLGFIFYGVLVSFNIAVSLLLLTELYKEVRSKLQVKIIILIVLIIINLIAVLYPLKLSIDEKNDCIAFYSLYEQRFQEHQYNFTFLNKCSFETELIGKLRAYKPQIEYNVPEVNIVQQINRSVIK